MNLSFQRGTRAETMLSVRLLLLSFGLLTACATPFAQVSKAKTIEEARQLLGSYQPQVTQYPPNAEAWYFGNNECVLFVDGILRLGKSSQTTRQSVTNPAVALGARQEEVLCAPSVLKDP